MGLLLRYLLLAWMLVWGETAAAGTLWLNDGRRVYAVDTAANEAVPLAAAHVRQLAATAKGETWALAGNQLRRLSANSAAGLAIPFAALGLQEVLQIAGDGYDASLWLTDGLWLVHVDADGAVIGRYPLPDQALGLAVGPDAGVWVLGRTQAVHYSADGRALSVLQIGTLAPPPAQLVLDALGQRLWILDGQRVQVVELSSTEPGSHFPVDARPRTLALEPKGGQLWVLSESALVRFDATGKEELRIALDQVGILAPTALALDPSDGSLWLAHAAGVAHLSALGEPLRAPTLAGIQTVAMEPFRLEPRLQLLTPEEGAATGPLPRFDLSLDALCNGAPCDLTPAYVEALALSAKLNERDISAEFTRAGANFTFTPAAPLPIGPHAFSAQATDPFGHHSEMVSRGFTVVEAESRAANKAPTVSLTAPTSGTTFSSGSTITLSATAVDNDGTIAKVEFYRGGTTLIGTATSSPYSSTWSNVLAGSYSLTAKATDNKGASTTSSAVAITVSASSNQAPTVSLTQPTNGTTVTAGSNLTLTATAADPDGSVSKVEFYQGTTLLGTATSAPFSVTWSAIPAGSYSLTAKATDNQGTVTTSGTVAITVNSAVPQVPPLVALTQPASCGTLTAPATVNLAADAISTQDRVIRVDFYNGTTLLGSATTEPYAYTWENVPTGNYSVTARAFDRRDLSTTSRAVTVSVGAANVPPAVALTQPANGSTFTVGTAVTLSASASDSDGTIKRVRFFSGSTLLATITAPPWQATWTPSATGVVNLTADATDDRGGVTTSVPVSVTIQANKPPTVSLTAPATGSVYTAPATIALSASASDVDGTVKMVDFYQGSTLLGTATSAPYTFTWTSVAAGTYTLTAKATDNQGGNANSTPVTVTVNPGLPPTVSLTAPADGTIYTAPADIVLTANASDPDGTVTKVDFYQGATLLGTATNAPYTFSWANVGAGTYPLTAKAKDIQGNTATSAPVTVTVNPNVPPTVSLTVANPDGNGYFAPANMALTATAADADGTVAKVDFYQGTTLLGTAVTAPYAFNWTNVPAGTYSLTAVATDNLGAAATSAPLGVTVSPSALTIVQPSDGAAVSGTSVLIKGTLSAPPNSGVTVNGVVAALGANNDFYALVPLNAGTNTITAVLTTSSNQIR